MGKAVDKRLYSALKPIKRRILLRHFIKYVLLGLILASAQAVVWLCASFLIPILYMWQKAAVCGFGIVLISVVVGAFFRPTLKDAAREADRLGLQERAITAYERMGLDDAFSVVQREDAIRRLKELDASAVSVMPPKRWVLGLVGMALLILVGSMFPNPQDQIVDRRIRVQREIENQVEQLQDRVYDNLAAEAELTREEKQELMNLVNELVRKLRQTRDYREALKEISKAEQKLTGLVRKFQQSRMALLGEELEKYPLTSALGRAAKSMDAQGIRDALESLKEQIEQGGIDAEAMESLGKALKDAADALPNGDLKQQLEEAALAAASNIASQAGDVTRELDSLQAMFTDMAQEGLVADPADIRYLLQNMKSRIAGAAGQDIRLVQNDNGAGQGSNSHSNSQNSPNQASNSQGLSGQDGGGSGSNTDTGSGRGSGNGQGSQGPGGSGNASGGQSSGSGSGNGRQNSSGGGAGSGTGAGHTNQDAGYQEDSSQSGYGQKGRGNPDSYGNYERIYDPTRLGDGGEVSQVTGKPTGQGQGIGEQVEAGPGMGSFDGFVPYNEVFGRYSRQAMENLERMDIPPGMRELIKEYFSALE